MKDQLDEDDLSPKEILHFLAHALFKIKLYLLNVWYVPDTVLHMG
jgi:hypothetical protein